jgi:hypothetical protein
LNYYYLALAKSVPQLDGAVTRAGHDLTIIRRERHRQHILRHQLLKSNVLILKCDIGTQMKPTTNDPTNNTDKITQLRTNLGVTDKATRGDAQSEIPKAQSTVPRARQRKCAIGRDHDVLHKVRVTNRCVCKCAIF